MNTGQNSCKEVVDRGKNRNRCGIDCSCYRGKECRNCIPDIREEIRNRLKRRTDAVPDSNEEVFYTRPHFIPGSTEPPEKYIFHTSQRVQNIAELVDYKIPDACKNALDTVPALLPVSRK